MSLPLRTVLVGVGRMGATYAEDPLTRRHFRHPSHADALAAHPGFAWEAAVDPDATALGAAQARWGFAHSAASIAELLGQYSPEVLVLATPPSAYLTSVEACPSLKAVLCEKPLGATQADAQALLRLCDARGILLQVNFWRRGDAMCRRLAAGELAALVGRPQVVTGLYGNGLTNNGSHLVDLCRMLFGEVAGASAQGPVLRRGELALADDFDVACTLRFANGVEALLRPLDYAQYREFGLDIWGEAGRLELLNEGLTCRLSRRGPHRALNGAREVCVDAPETLPSTAGDALYEIYENLAAAVQGRAPLLSPGASANQTALVIETIRNAALADDERAHTPRSGT